VTEWEQINELLAYDPETGFLRWTRYSMASSNIVARQELGHRFA
jgi:hypothetical protein